jgi:dynein heavy chain
MDAFLRPSINFVRDHLKELSPTVDNNLAASLMRLLDCFLLPLRPQGEGAPPVSDKDVAKLVAGVEELFFFCLVWSVGCTTNDEGRRKFDSYVRNEFSANGLQKVRSPPSL